MMLKLKSTLFRTTKHSLLSKLQKMRFCSHNHTGLLIFSLYIIILLTQQAVALSIPPHSSTSSAASSASSLVMISPQVNNSASALMFPPETSAMNVLTPGQRVINAVPVEDRGNFILYQLAIGLEATDFAQTQFGWLSDLSDYIKYIEQTMPFYKNVPVYENFAADLLHWQMVKFNFTYQDVYFNLRSRSQILCNSDGTCYSSADMGCYCCPF